MSYPFNIPDPEFHQQQKKYKNPIPSRTAILNFLKEKKKLMKLERVAEQIGIHDVDQLEALSRRLKAMVHDGTLIVNRKKGYGVRKKTDLIKGVVQAHRDGYGFFVSPELEEDGYIMPRQMRKVMDGDTVLASIQHSGVRKNKSDVFIVEVLERAHKTLAGKFFHSGAQGVVEPDNNSIDDIIIPAGSEAQANDGDYVTVMITQYPTKQRPAIGEVIAVLGQKLNSRLAMELTMAAQNLPSEWPESFAEVRKNIPQEVSEEDKQGIRDLRKLPLVTIDGEDARDFDDAVYAKPNNKGWKLYVAIADVSKYVQPGSEIDKEAFKRGTSVYFPGKVIPMLPLELSNGICSLNPEVERMCMVCEMQINHSGEIESFHFYRAVMFSHARITYKQAWEYLSNNQAQTSWHPEVAPALSNMYELFKIMNEERNRRGAIDFKSSDVNIHIDKEGQVSAITPYERNDAHKLIENFMIAANICAAKFIENHKIPAAFRVHDQPPLSKLTDLKAFLHSLGIKPQFNDPVEPKDFEKIIELIQTRKDVNLIESVLLRSQSLAVYEPANKGHFGLALSHYAHFTSPIRRYPDLMVHRALEYIVEHKKQGKYHYNPEQAAEMTVQCSMNERRAEQASRDVDARLKCMFMEQFIGEEMQGIVSGVTHFGIFVTLNDIMVDGLVHVTSLPNDYYHHDQIHHVLVGKRSGQRFQLADKIKVKVAAVSIDDRKIDFDFVEKLNS